MIKIIRPAKVGPRLWAHKCPLCGELHASADDQRGLSALEMSHAARAAAEYVHATASREFLEGKPCREFLDEK